MDWSKMKIKFHGSWHSKIQKFIESKECDKIFAFLKSRKEEGIEIAPSSFCLFKAFRDTNLDELNLIIIGENPYNKFVDGVPIDTGILFGANTRIQDDLQEFYNGMEKELYNGLNLEMIYDYDLSYLTSQGILMIPSSLTIEKDSEKGHNKLWKPFIEYLLTEIIGPTGIPILFLGRSNQYIKLVEQSNYCFQLPLPKFGNLWETKGTLTKINEQLWTNSKDLIFWRNLVLPF